MPSASFGVAFEDVSGFSGWVCQLEDGELVRGSGKIHQRVHEGPSVVLAATISVPRRERGASLRLRVS